MIHSGGEEGKRQRGRGTKKKGRSRYSCRSCIAHRQTETRSRSVHATHVENASVPSLGSKAVEREKESHKREAQAEGEEYEGEEGERRRREREGSR